MDLIAGVNGLGNRLANGGRAILHGLASCMAQPGRAAKAAGRNRLCVHPGAPVA
jgi:hypothetical protein